MLRAAVCHRLGLSVEESPEGPVPEIPEAVLHGIVERLAQEVGSTCGPSVVLVVSRLRSAGLSADSAKQVAAVLFSDPHLVEGWHDWHEVTDREEIRMRLEILARCDRVSDDLAPFITFFFRASVADLFRPAAIALGRHAVYRAEMMASLRLFARQRQIDLSSPIVLNGQRSRRRALLALCGAVTSPEATPERFAEAGLSDAPLRVERPDGERARVHLGTDSRDLISVLGALDLLLEAGWGDADLPGLAADLLREVCERPLRSLSRHTIQRAGALLSTLASRSGGHGDALDGWALMIERQRRELGDSEASGLAMRIGQLMRLDDMLRAVLFLPGEHARELLRKIPRHSGGLVDAYLAERLRAWAVREQTDAAPEVMSAFGLPEAAEYGVSGPGRVRRPAEIVLAAASTSADGDGQAGMLGDLVSLTRDRGVWNSCSTSTQSLVIFYTLDVVSHPIASERRLAALFGGLGWGSDATAPPTLQSLAGRMLMRVLSWEPAGTESFIDNRLLHQLDDDDVLFGLVPSRASPLIPDLTDALEHRVRLHLQRQPRFGLVAWLHRLAVRRPYPALLRQLHEVSSGRHYARASGESVHLSEIVEWFEAYLSGDHAAGPSAVAREDGAFIRQRDRVRTRLQDLAGLTHPDELLGALLDVTGSPDDQSHAVRRSTVVRLLQSIHPREHPVVRGAYPAWAERSIDALCAEIAVLAHEIQTSRAELVPDRWNEVDAMPAAASSILNRLTRLNALISPLLPEPESALFESATASARQAIESWLAALGSLPADVLEVDLDPLSGGDGPSADQAASLLSNLAALPVPALRERMVTVAWDSLRRRAGAPVSVPTGGGGESSHVDGWMREHALLIAVVDLVPLEGGTDGLAWSEDERHRWGGLLASAWTELADRAMADRDEERVVDLLERGAFAPLRTAPAAGEAVLRLRNWCLDHHLLDAARRAACDHAAARGRPEPGLSAVIGAWLGRFMVIWFALLIGSILMLDFGDGWRAMAEEQDVRGITLTALIGLAGSYGYLFLNLRQRIAWRNGTRWGSLFRRVSGFFGVCVVYTALIVAFMWWLLSRTDEVVQGAWAIGHIVVWAGFALFIGVFFGLISKNY